MVMILPVFGWSSFVSGRLLLRCVVSCVLAVRPCCRSATADGGATGVGSIG